MAENPASIQSPIAAWHRNLLAAAAVFTVLLIVMGGVLCVTHSIRGCPDWPGCFGKILPPLETSPILEVTHRLLAGSSGLLILGAAIAGLTRARRWRWIVYPPLAAIPLLVLVSAFGALVVVRGLASGWAAFDLGSALLVVALMVTSAVIAHARRLHPALPDRLTFYSPFSRLVLATLGVVYIVLVSGVLVAGKNSLTGCLGWPIYSQHQFEVDSHGVGNILRLGLSGAGILLVIAVLVQAWRSQRPRRAIIRTAGWVGAAFLVEVLVQGLLLASGFQVSLLVPYTAAAAALWGLLVALAVETGLDADLN